MSPLFVQMSLDYGVDLKQELLISIIYFLHHFNDEIFGYVVLHDYVPSQLQKHLFEIP